MGAFRRFIGQRLKRHGIVRAPRHLDAFEAEANRIVARHQRQTLADVAALRARHAEPIFGDVLVWDLINRLGEIHDPTDTGLGSTSQLVHTINVAAAMERDGVTDEDMLVAALIHDTGKLLMLAGEAPENVVCMNDPIGVYEDGAGLDTVTFQWNHDEFGYDRFRDHVPEHIAWLLRYHSIHFRREARLMNARDREWTAKYLKPFHHYDQNFKSPFRPAEQTLSHWRDLIFDRFPRPIPF
ncbi:inositol oxygenase family protein [Iodidimonas sp. SYSU 1G8]|uniref:inositol oxygenase family protein n=1 Tax=Iodidimonas sp. SYSU 1G8 TaxID=3133967 RepID=UPI0031FF3212